MSETPTSKGDKTMAKRVAERFLTNTAAGVRSTAVTSKDAIDRLVAFGDKMNRKYGPSPWYVYEGRNETNKAIYYGASNDPKARISGSHCEGATKALTKWDFDDKGGDKISWSILSTHEDQPAASAEAHRLETIRVPGYEVIQTGGI